MASKSESSIGNSAVHRGIPTKCGCGAGVKVYTSSTSDNPGRPFFRCESMIKKDHLFKWVEEAVLEEVEDLNGKVGELNKVRSDVDSMIFEVYELHKEVVEVKEEVQKMRIGAWIIGGVTLIGVAIAKFMW